MITFNGATAFRLNAGRDGKNISVRGVPAGVATAINGGAGPDSIRLGSGNVDADLLSPVAVDGGPGNDEVAYLNHLDGSVGSQTLDGSSFTDGLTHTSSAVESIIIENGSGGGTFDLLRATVPTIFTSGSFQQAVNIGNGNLDANLLADVSIGTAGQVTVDDRLDAGDDSYTIGNQGWRKTNPGARLVSLGNVAAAVLQASNGNNTIRVDQGNNKVRVFANGGNDHVIVADTVPLFTVETVGIDTGPEQPGAAEPFGDYVTVNSDAGAGDDAGAKVRLLASDVIHRLTVHPAGTFQVPTGVTCWTVEPGLWDGVIDLAGGALIVSNATHRLAAFNAYVKGGHNGGSWDGTGTTRPDGTRTGAVNSSLAASSSALDAVGVAPASALFRRFPAVFMGRTLGANDVVFRHTLAGDANLDGLVDVRDYGRLRDGLGRPIARWDQGDFNFDGRINGTDFAIFRRHLGKRV